MPKVNKHTPEACGAGLGFILRPIDPMRQQWLPRIADVQKLCDRPGKEIDFCRLLRPGIARKCPRCCDVWGLYQKLKHEPDTLAFQIEEENKIPHGVETTQDPAKCYVTLLYVGPLKSN